MIYLSDCVYYGCVTLETLNYYLIYKKISFFINYSLVMILILIFNQLLKPFKEKKILKNSNFTIYNFINLFLYMSIIMAFIIIKMLMVASNG